MENLSPVSMPNAQWIWLNPEKYAQYQHCKRTASGDKSLYSFCVAELKRELLLSKEVASAKMTLCADTKYRLYANGNYIGLGPVSSGGDFAGSDAPPYIYTSTYALPLQIGKNTLFAQVQLSSSAMAEVSWGRGGFLAACEIHYTDGSTEVIVSDPSWEIRVNYAFESDGRYDAGKPAGPWEPAVLVDNIPWQVKTSPIPTLHEEFIRPNDYLIFDEYKELITIQGNEIHIKAGAPVSFIARFDKIYSGYLSLEATGEPGVCVGVKCQEMIGRVNPYPCKSIILSGETSYRCMRMDSIGYYQISVSNMMEQDVVIKNLGLYFSCYPITQEGHFFCDDEVLNKIYEVGKWTLQICRQSLHLDSPLHQEPLSDPGDYLIQSLMNYYTFGDPRLTRFDLVRMAEILRRNDGRMFHTSYSVMLPQMSLDYYRYSGDLSLLEEVADAYHILMERFQGYLGDTGVLENAPNYMFVDWVPVDGYNMHHPPKALGQTCLNAFYYKALVDMVELCTLLGDSTRAGVYQARASLLKPAFQRRFWVEEKQLYCDGSTEPQSEAEWLPANPSKQYFSQHANTLAVLYHLCEPALEKELIRKVITDSSLIQAQPYFMHFVLDAIASADEFDVYGLAQIRRWKKLTDECDRGLKECWYGFDCDYSHAWGGTPTYQLPARILGLCMVEPGFRKITLSPRLFGLQRASIGVPTPFGLLTAQLEAGKAPVFHIPEGIDAQIISA